MTTISISVTPSTPWSYTILGTETIGGPSSSSNGVQAWRGRCVGVTEYVRLGGSLPRKLVTNIRGKQKFETKHNLEH